ncbi:DUF4157 domain-containing protein [Streptomyces sp. NPDC092307]|uniref:eCIS core domain-containing protein n=1 Tax=Streptomyces sp. NPDC092307 TaxID=3366013 RepID=UPI00380EBA4E
MKHVRSGGTESIRPLSMPDRMTGRDAAPGTGAAGHLWALQRSVGNSAVRQLLGVAPGAAGLVAHAVRGAGLPLPRGLRERMEQRLGADLATVRTHEGTAADTSAQALSADAYTTGEHIVFSSSHAPAADPELLAHELTHVLQQRRGPVPGTRTDDGLSVSDPHDTHERAAAGSASAPLSAPVGAQQGTPVQRVGGWQRPPFAAPASEQTPERTSKRNNLSKEERIRARKEKEEQAAAAKADPGGENKRNFEEEIKSILGGLKPEEREKVDRIIEERDGDALGLLRQMGIRDRKVLEGKKKPRPNQNLPISERLEIALGSAEESVAARLPYGVSLDMWKQVEGVMSEVKERLSLNGSAGRHVMGSSVYDANPGDIDTGIIVDQETYKGLQEEAWQANKERTKKTWSEQGETSSMTPEQQEGALKRKKNKFMKDTKNKLGWRDLGFKDDPLNEVNGLGYGPEVTIAVLPEYSDLYMRPSFRVTPPSSPRPQQRGSRPTDL